MDKASIMEKINSSGMTLTEFYMYPTGYMGESIAETDDHNGRSHDKKLKALVTHMLEKAVGALGTRIDNKIAVKAEVDGLDFPVFFCFKDGRYCIAKEVKQKDGRAPENIIVRVEALGE